MLIKKLNYWKKFQVLENTDNINHESLIEKGKELYDVRKVKMEGDLKLDRLIMGKSKLYQ